MKVNYKDRAHYDGTTYEMYHHHRCQGADRNEIEKALLTYEIRYKAERCHHPCRLRVHQARLKLSFHAAITVPHYKVQFNAFADSNRAENICLYCYSIKSSKHCYKASRIIMIIVVD